jgi:hypothetical protein
MHRTCIGRSTTRTRLRGRNCFSRKTMSHARQPPRQAGKQRSRETCRSRTAPGQPTRARGGEAATRGRPLGSSRLPCARTRTLPNRRRERRRRRAAASERRLFRGPRPAVPPATGSPRRGTTNDANTASAAIAVVARVFLRSLWPRSQQSRIGEGAVKQPALPSCEMLTLRPAPSCEMLTLRPAFARG